MMKNYILRFLTICIAMLFLYDCSSPTKSKKSKTIVTINDVWITNAEDNDGDGYNSYLRLNFDLDVNKPDSVEVFVLLGVRVTDPMDTASYYIYFESVDFKIAGASTADGKYISVGSPNIELPMGVFDFLLEVYYSSDPNTRITYASKTEDADMGGISMETFQEDIVIYTDWLSYNDGSFENGYAINNDYGYFAVKFDQPAGALTCVVKQIAYHISVNASNVWIRGWDDFNNYPDTRIYTTTTNTYLNTGWNFINIDIDVSSYDPFYIGYYQINYGSGSPYISADETTPLFGRSYYRPISASSWTNDTDGDYAIEVFIEYTSTSANGKSIVKSEWLSAELQ